MAKNFGSLANFLEATKDLDKQVVRDTITSVTDEVTNILNESAVKLSVLKANSGGTEQVNNLRVAIVDSLDGVVKENIKSTQSIFQQMLESFDNAFEREAYWVAKLVRMFGLPEDIPLEDKKALIDKYLFEDDTTAAYVSHMMENQKLN